MKIFPRKELEKIAHDYTREKKTTFCDGVYFFMHPDKEKKEILPSAVILVGNDKNILLQYSSARSSYILNTPKNIGYKKIVEKIDSDVTNKNIASFLKEMSKTSKTIFIPNEDLLEVDDFSLGEIADTVNAASDLLERSILEELVIMNDEITQKIQEVKSSKKTKATQTNTRIAEQKGMIPEDKYKEFCRKRTLEINKIMDSQWRGLSYDRKNEIQEQIIERFGEGQSIMLMGDTGIGKTFNPEYIAKSNNMSYMTVKLHRASDSVELLGKPSFRANAITGEQEMYFDRGFLTNAFEQASKNAYQQQKGYVLILDEILRAEDMTPFISNLSISGENEYVLSVDESNTFAKINTLVDGDFWFYVSDDIDRERQTYTINENGKIHLSPNDTNALYKFSGSAEQAAERHFRGDLLSIHRQDFQGLLRKNRHAVIATHSEKTKIYTPQRAIAIVGTTNIGENYEVNMGADNALTSRLNPILTKAPKISYMVNKTIERISETKNWTPDEERYLKKVVGNFANALSKVFNNNKSIENPQKINFRILNDIISGIAPERPFADGKWNVESVLKRSAIKFLTVDSSLSAEEIASDPILDAVVRGAEKAMELSENPSFKGVKESSLKQEKPLAIEEDEEESMSMGMGR